MPMTPAVTAGWHPTLCATVVVLASLFSVPAGADTPQNADGYEASLVRAVTAKERALDADDSARWEDALREFQAAGAIRETAEANYEIGFAAQHLQRLDLAVEAYEAALEHWD
jgi:hypothetical protein